MTGSGTATPRRVLVPWGHPSWVAWGWQSCGSVLLREMLCPPWEHPQAEKKKGWGTACQAGMWRAGCGQSVCDPPAWGWAVGEREKAPGTAQPAETGNEQSGSGSLLHPPLEGRRMPGTREGPALLSPGALGMWGQGIPRLGRDEGVSGGLSCPGTVQSDPACARSVLEEGRGAAAEQHGAAHQGGGRASHLAGAQRAGGRRRALHGDGGQRGGRHVLQCHPQRAAR